MSQHWKRCSIWHFWRKQNVWWSLGTAGTYHTVGVTSDLSFLGRLSVVSVANADRRTDSYKGTVLEQSGPGWIRGTSKEYTTDPENMILLHVGDAICPEQCRNFIYIARKMVQAFCWRHFQVLGCRILHCLVLSQTLPNYVVFFYLGILRVLFILKLATTSIYMGWPAESGSPLFHTTFVTNCRGGQVRQLPLGLWCIWKINFKKHCCNIIYKFLWFQILRCL